MRRMLVIVAAIALLTGCSAEPTIPPPPTDAEIVQIEQRLAASWWKDLYPTEPQPQVETIERVNREDRSAAIEGCLREADAPGVTDTGAVTFDGVSQAAIDEFFRAQWVCVQQYPVVIDDEERGYFMSDAQLSYVYDYLVGRLVPCLKMIGYDVAVAPTREVFVEVSSTMYGELLWNPYMELRPMPNQAEEWRPLVAQCPPPPYPDGLLPRDRSF
jgi:hypothetical protein